jgi:uncharacterized protein YbjT (DUF2867 family)
MLPGMKVILTGATGMVGEGVLLECLASPSVDAVLCVGRRSCGHTHAKLTECLTPDFRDLPAVESRLAGYDACFYCAGVSSVGMSEADYTVATYDTTLAFATTLARLDPKMVLTYVSGASTDGTEQGRVMWARVKGKTENALTKVGLKAVYNFRPGLMKPTAGQKNLKRSYRLMLPLLPVAGLFFPTLTLSDVGKAMIRCAQLGAPGRVLEVKDIAAMAKG